MHKGKIVEKAVRSSGISITQLARKLKRSRQWVYQIFQQEQVSTDDMLAIGKAIHYDFSTDLKSFNTLGDPTPPENKIQDNNAEYWKQKYISLLEEYNELLKKK